MSYTLSGSIEVSGSINIPILTGSAINVNNLSINTAATVNGQNVLTQADAPSFVQSVNGVAPVNGNVSVSLVAVLTGTSASLATSSSGALTGSISNGTVWVVSGDATPANNGDTYIFQSGSSGQWLAISPLDESAGDARYVLQNGNAIITGSLLISGSGVTVNLKGDTIISGSLQLPLGNTIRDNSGTNTIDPSNRYLIDSATVTSIDWENRTSDDSSGNSSLNWENRRTFDVNGITSIRWNDRRLTDDSAVASIRWNERTLNDTSGNAIVDW